MIDSRRKQQLETDIQDLKSKVRHELGQIEFLRSVRGKENEVKGLELDVKHNRIRIAELEAELKS